MLFTKLKSCLIFLVWESFHCESMLSFIIYFLHQMFFLPQFVAMVDYIDCFLNTEL